MKINKKETARKSELLIQIRADPKAWEEAEPDSDDNYFGESDVVSHYDFLIDKHQGK